MLDIIDTTTVLLITLTKCKPEEMMTLLPSGIRTTHIQDTLQVKKVSKEKKDLEDTKEKSQSTSMDQGPVMINSCTAFSRTTLLRLLLMKVNQLVNSI